MELTSKQRAQLRGLANSIDTILQVGKDGIGANLIKQADDALEARELIKGRVLDNNIDYDARTAAEELAKGHSKPREKRIQLVKPAKKRPQ
ncbi:RNA-binding protein YhbY [uncultured Blautia sp.]|nr:RNA-binding protein YhbY [uncultured Blautia sp.]